MTAAELCPCRTVKIEVLVTAGTYDAATAKAREIAADVSSDGPFWITASRYPTAVDRHGCLVGLCGRPGGVSGEEDVEVDPQLDGSTAPSGSSSADTPSDDVRPWVRRLGSYLRIFGPPAPGTLGWRTAPQYLDSLIKQAKRREEELGG